MVQLAHFDTPFSWGVYRLVTSLLIPFSARKVLKALEVYSPLPSICKIRSEEHTSELQSLRHLVCRLLLVKENKASAMDIALLNSRTLLAAGAYTIHAATTPPLPDASRKTTTILPTPTLDISDSTITAATT